jgi:GTPase SAR1 family protein
VPREEGEAKAKQIGADHFCEVSSKENIGIEELFQQAARIAVAKLKKAK